MYELYYKKVKNYMEDKRLNYEEIKKIILDESENYPCSYIDCYKKLNAIQIEREGNSTIWFIPDSNIYIRDIFPYRNITQVLPKQITKIKYE